MVFITTPPRRQRQSEATYSQVPRDGRRPSVHDIPCEASRSAKMGEGRSDRNLYAQVGAARRRNQGGDRASAPTLGSKCRDLPGRPGRQGGETPAADRGGEHWQGAFGLWRVRFPPCLVRPGRRLPVQGLSEGSLGPGRENRATKFGDSRKKGKKGQWCSWSQNKRGTKCFGTTNTSCIDQSSPMARRAGGRGGSGTRGGRGEGRARVRTGKDGGTERMRGGAGARQHRPDPSSGAGAHTGQPGREGEGGQRGEGRPGKGYLQSPPSKVQWTLEIEDSGMYVYYYRTYEKAVSGGGRGGKRRTCAKGPYQPRPVRSSLATSH